MFAQYLPDTWFDSYCHMASLIELIHVVTKCMCIINVGRKDYSFSRHIHNIHDVCESHPQNGRCLVCLLTTYVYVEATTCVVAGPVSGIVADCCRSLGVVQTRPVPILPICPIHLKSKGLTLKVRVIIVV